MHALILVMIPSLWTHALGELLDRNSVRMLMALFSSEIELVRIGHWWNSGSGVQILTVFDGSWRSVLVLTKLIILVLDHLISFWNRHTPWKLIVENLSAPMMSVSWLLISHNSGSVKCGISSRNDGLWWFKIDSHRVVVYLWRRIHHLKSLKLVWFERSWAHVSSSFVHALELLGRTRVDHVIVSWVIEASRGWQELLREGHSLSLKTFIPIWVLSYGSLRWMIQI